MIFLLPCVIVVVFVGSEDDDGLLLVLAAFYCRLLLLYTFLHFFLFVLLYAACICFYTLLFFLLLPPKSSGIDTKVLQRPGFLFLLSQLVNKNRLVLTHGSLFRRGANSASLSHHRQLLSYWNLT